MKKLVCLFFCLTVGFQAIAQEKSGIQIELDYIVDYTIGPAKNGITASIGFDKSGRFLWSDFEMFKTILSGSMGRTGIDNVFKNGKVQLIFDAKELQFFIHFNNEKNTMFMKMNFDDFYPDRYVNAEKIPEDISLISEKTDNELTILDKTHKLYSVYPSTESSSKLSIVFDKKYPVNNNKIFGDLFSMILKKMEGTTVTSIDLPKGLLLYAENKNEVLLKATAVRKTKKVITINHSIDIKE